MGLRSRIKETVKGLLGKEAPSNGATAPAGAMPSTAATPISSPPRPVAAPTPVATPAPAPLPAPAPAKAVAAAEAPAEAAGTAPAGKPTDPEKIRKHHLKTKAGMLRWLGEQGGSSHMGPMHDHSERRFFVAHRAFSNLMEELTNEGLVTYDSQDGMVVLTDAGRDWKA